MNRVRPERLRTADFPTVAELAGYGALAATEVVADGDPQVVLRRVTLASDIDAVRRCPPGTAVVLHPSAATGGWALESVLRVAWERNASCVLTPASAVVTPSPGRLAGRLRLWLFATRGDPADIALELAAQVAQPTVARFRLAARCADLISGQGSFRGIVGVLNAELVGVEVALVGQGGMVLAGRKSALTVLDPVRVPVPGPDGRPWAELVAAVGSTSGPAWREIVTTILHLARAPLALCRARERLTIRQRTARNQIALAGLLGPLNEAGPLPDDRSEPDEVAAQPAAGALAAADSGDPDPVAAARDRGWLVDPPLVGVYVRLAAPSAAGRALLLDRWSELDSLHPLVPRGPGFVSWWSGPDTDPAGTARAVRALIARAAVGMRIAVGIGEAVDSVAELAATCGQAELAAAAALSRPEDGPCRFDELGINAVLSAVPLADVARIARVSLAELALAPDREALIRTGRAVLDAGGSTATAAAALAVHRNTVHLRMDRLRARGIDLSDPERRLALHLALTALSLDAD